MIAAGAAAIGFLNGANPGRLFDDEADGFFEGVGLFLDGIDDGSLGGVRPDTPGVPGSPLSPPLPGLPPAPGLLGVPTPDVPPLPGLPPAPELGGPDGSSSSSSSSSAAST